MALYINELGEFVDVDPPDCDARRAVVYRSCIEVDAKAFKEEYELKKEKKNREKPVYVRECLWCHERFTTNAPNKVYCSSAHQQADYNKKRREANAARREARS